jgi:hypothetical protein
MATRMKLIPETWFSNFSDKSDPSIENAKVDPSNTMEAELLKYVPDFISVDKNGQIVYKDGTKGTSLEGMIKYLTTDGVAERPFDSDKFLRLLINVGAPAEAVAPRFSRYFPNEDINIKQNKSDKLPNLQWKRY